MAFRALGAERCEPGPAPAALPHAPRSAQRGGGLALGGEGAGWPENGLSPHTASISGVRQYNAGDGRRQNRCEEKAMLCDSPQVPAPPLASLRLLAQKGRLQTHSALPALGDRGS